MAIEACRECGGKVSTEAKTCPHCGAARPVAATSVSGGFCGCLALGIVVILVAGLIAESGSRPQTAAERKASEESAINLAARALCKQEVLERLKAPSTAKFVSAGYESGPAAADKTGKTWLVRGSVDAQNGFGAMIRNRYACEFQHVSGRQFIVKSVLIL